MESHYSLNQKIKRSQKQSQINNSTLLLIAFATAFFPRFFSYFGAPSIIDFAHFIIVPVVFLIVILTSKISDRKAILATWELLAGIAILLSSMTTSAVISSAGIINLALQFMFFVEPFMLLAAIVAIPLSEERLKRLQHWLLGFALINLLLAIVQSVLIPAGIYPKKGGTDEDSITGVFGGGGGSAGNYVSCTVSFYFAIYFFNNFKHLPMWIRLLPILGSLYQIQASDSKQVFLALIAGWAILILTNLEKPTKMLVYGSLGFVAALIASWALLNLESEFLSPYQNWINRSIWGWDGLAAQTKFAMVRIVPSYFETPLNWLLGLGPGHTVTRLGGWFLSRSHLQNLLLQLGATTHPASLDAWDVVSGTHLPRESTIFFPLFSWIGIWGDIGIVGLASYLYLGSIVWRRFCPDNFCKFILLSTASFGWILTQMEEPGHMLTVAVLVGLRWQEERVKQKGIGTSTIIRNIAKT